LRRGGLGRIRLLGPLVVAGDRPSWGPRAARSPPEQVEIHKKAPDKYEDLGPSP